MNIIGDPNGLIYDTYINSAKEEAEYKMGREELERKEIETHIELMNQQIMTEKAKGMYYMAMSAKLFNESDSNMNRIFDRLLKVF